MKKDIVILKNIFYNINVMYMKEFSRFINLIGEEKFELLQQKTILIIGLGGVGGYCVETLARSGFNHLILVDFDKIDITNINRQIIALHDNIDCLKSEEFKKRINLINPDCKVDIINEYINENNIDLLFLNKIDYIVDACDTINTKKLIIKEASKRNIKLISVMGMGNKIDPTKIIITELSKTSYDPIAKILRKYVREEKINNKIMVISSNEEVKVRDKTIFSNSYVPPVAGLYCTFYIINDIINNEGMVG